MSREMTLAECRAAFLDHIRARSHYWATDTRTTDRLEMCNGLCHSILSMLNGNSGIPGFALVPQPHESDAEYHREQGENWWPAEEVKNDIREDACLHHEFYHPQERKPV